jgi:cyclic pyranopterin phosphate synthase
MTQCLPDKLIDPCNRHLNYLRISITDRCNLSCTYCLPQESIPRLDHAEVLSYEEILRIARVAARLGVTKIRVTGGEPLVRKGVYGFLAELAALPGIEDISLTTNGVLLAENARRILDAGIRRINVSIDTLKPQRFREITGTDAFDRVWQGVRLAESLGFDPIKLNVVALQGVNDDELLDLARLSLDAPYHVRFIEYMPIGRSRLTGQPLLLVPEIKKRLGSLGRLVAVAPSQNDGPAQRYRFAGARGEIGFIPAISHHFCDRCNRLRLTASGQLRPCLLSDRCEDLKGPMRRGASDAEIAEIFRQTVRHKPSDHNLAVGEAAHVCSQMRSIGG